MNEGHSKDSTQESSSGPNEGGSKSLTSRIALYLGWFVLALYFITIALHGEFKTDLAFWVVAAAMTIFGIAAALLARSKVLLLLALLVPAAQLILMLLAFASLIILMLAKAAVNLVAQLFTGEMVWPEPMSF